jgi:hypothetical protein
MSVAKPFLLSAMALLFSQLAVAYDQSARHISPDAARQMAIGALHRGHVPVSRYDPPSVTFDRKHKEWHVFFHGKSDRVADWVDIIVDDRTSKTHVHWGK